MSAPAATRPGSASRSSGVRSLAAGGPAQACRGQLPPPVQCRQAAPRPRLGPAQGHPHALRILSPSCAVPFCWLACTRIAARAALHRRPGAAVGRAAWVWRGCATRMLLGRGMGR